MEDADCLGVKIMSNVENHLKSDPEIDEYDILPVLTSAQNRNPVQLVEHKLGIDSWGAKLMFHTAAKDLGRWLKAGRKSVNSEKDFLLARTMCVLLIVPDHSTAWNIRKDLVTNELLGHSDDFRLSRLILTKHPKSPETFFHRRWLLSDLLSHKLSTLETKAVNVTHPQVLTMNCQLASENANEARSETASSEKSPTTLASNSVVFSKEIRHRSGVVHSDQRHCLVLQELLTCHQAAEQYRNNYNAWSHRIWVVQHLSCCRSQIIDRELETTKRFVCSHISDHSGFQYRQFLMKSSSSCGLDVSELLHHELLLTTDLITTYPGHEAIWYHRRFVLEYSLKFPSLSSNQLSSVLTRTNEDYDCADRLHVPKRTRLESVALTSLLSDESEWCRNLLEGFSVGSWQQTLVNHHLRWLNHNLAKSN